MYRVDRNNYNTKVKEVVIYTPELICNTLYDILSPHIAKDKVVIDPCVGSGRLIKRFIKTHRTYGIDIAPQIMEEGSESLKIDYYNFITDQYIGPKDVGLVLINPPFNNNFDKTGLGGRPSVPELFLDRSFELFGKGVPLAIFVPYGVRLNQTRNSKRWLKFISGSYPEIRSIISLPKDAFPEVKFHCEILCFNLPDIKPHYFI